MAAKRNAWTPELGRLLDEAPKNVWAAIAARLAALCLENDHWPHAGECGESAIAEIVADEWRMLHRTGAVPQKPGKRARELLAGLDSRDPYLHPELAQKNAERAPSRLVP